MTLIQTILMGIVQGLSEFLPISSSAHLVFTSNFYKVMSNVPIEITHNTEEIFCDIMLHLGTLVAVIIFFRKEILEILKSLFQSLKTKDFTDNNSKLGLYIILGTILTIAVALPLDKVAEHLVFHPSIVGILLVGTGFVLFYSEYLAKKNQNNLDKLDLKKSIFIGIAQGIAALPGFSRSGLTIATGLFSGLKREIAARYSFLLSIPIILGASMIYPLIKINFEEAKTFSWGAILLGTIVSAIVGYLCIKYFMKFISKFSLKIFAYYCIIMGLFSFIFFQIK